MYVAPHFPFDSFDDVTMVHLWALIAVMLATIPLSMDLQNRAFIAHYSFLHGSSKLDIHHSCGWDGHGAPQHFFLALGPWENWPHTYSPIHTVGHPFKVNLAPLLSKPGSPLHYCIALFK